MSNRKRIVCTLLCVLIISIFSLTGCNTDKDKEKDPEGVITTDLKLADVEVNMHASRSGQLEDTSKGSFVLLKKFEECDVSVYHYEEYKEAMGQEIHMSYIVLERDGVYNMFLNEMPTNVMEEGISTSECYDYDGDGEEEITATFVVDENEIYKVENLYVFDYDSNRNSYNMYCLTMNALIDTVGEAVIKFYSEQHGIEYEFEGSVNYEHFYWCLGENFMRYGNYMDITLSDNGAIKIPVSVFETLGHRLEDTDADTMLTTSRGIYKVIGDEWVLTEEFTYTEVGYVNCDIKYMGDGKFIINASEYKEDTNKRNIEKATE